MGKWAGAAFVAAAFMVSTGAMAEEPAYCTYSAFMQHEISYSRRGLKRQHVFQFGSLHLIGLAVGQSDTDAVEAMAGDFTDAARSEKYCTWYHNKGNGDAEEALNWFPVDKPGKDIERAVAQYRDRLGGIFADNAINMLECAEQHEYIALGCDGQKHRGPTVFGMLLAFSGCSPEHAAEIVNSIWGLNGVPADSRLAVIAEGHRLGESDPRASQALRELLSQ